MPWRNFGVMSMLLALSGCAETTYQAVQDGPGEAQSRALADCRVKAVDYYGVLIHKQVMDDCMRSKGYVPAKS